MVTIDDSLLTPVRLRRDLLAEGETDQSLARAVRHDVLARPRRGAYVDAGVWHSLGSEGRFAVRSRAAYLQARAPVALSHASAMPFYDGPLWGADLDDVHFTRLDEHAGRREAGVRQHAGTLEDGDVVTAHGLTLTSPARTALDVTFTQGVDSALAAVCHLLRERLVDMETLRARYDRRMDHWPHSLRTDLVLRLADPRLASVGEVLTYLVFWRQHLPRPHLQLEIRDADFLAYLDFALPDHGVWVEFDGRAKYEKHRRTGESVTDAVLREKLREQRISELTGWRCLRLTWADLAHPERVAARLRRLIDSVATSRRRAGA
ncbi:hypothetical protein KUV85_05935 [Nocardioides panacisoli]|uniref:hypothetical protein n=1 Tax=Nocardioides panacisoli TaxID=627624 RepID=UPI001C626548|nr:hypothetical protein [Nocardioides panacisoli]QYJ05219.1 hypothetical protein KUV85_05935 [Nocardioides panacisoli]